MSRSTCQNCFAPDGHTAQCHSNTCQLASGHWQEVATNDPEEGGVLQDASDICGCQAQCIAHPLATAFQFNEGGWCGCLQMVGTTFDAAVQSQQFLVPGSDETGCALCNIEQMARYARSPPCPSSPR